MTSPLLESNRTLARPVYELLSSHSSSQWIKLGNISENVGERPTSLDQQIWTSRNVPGSGRMAPKVPGSRPGQLRAPPRTLSIRGSELHSQQIANLSDRFSVS